MDDLLVHDLISAVMASCYRATGAPDGIAYLLCPVTSGPAELELMRDIGEADGAGNRTREALRIRFLADGRWETVYVPRVIEPNRAQARIYASRARRSLLARGIGAVVFDPTYVDVRALALELGIEMTFDRPRYLAVNDALFRDHATHLVVCPGAEFGGAMRSAIEDTRSRGLQIITPDGTSLTSEEIAMAVARARATVLGMGFSKIEADAYLGV